MKSKPRLKTLWKSYFCLLLITFHISLGFCRPSRRNANPRSQSVSPNNDDSQSSTLQGFQSDTSMVNIHSEDKKESNRAEVSDQRQYLTYSYINANGSMLRRLARNNNSISSFPTAAHNDDFERELGEFLLGNNGIVSPDPVDYIFVGDGTLIDESSARSNIFLVDDEEPSQSDVSPDVINGFEEDEENNVAVLLVARPKDVSGRQTSPVMNGTEVAPFIDEESRKLESRNLSRKRRQRSNPKTQQSHHRRRRKRKRRHRLLLKSRDSKRNHLVDSQDGFSNHKGHRDRFLLRSDSPGYVITSASEVKKDWCRTVPLRQKVSEPHCRTKVVKNNFCYGQCNSFFIPHSGRTGNNVAFQSCAFCKPHRPKWGNVTLNCPGRNPPKIQKTILIVETCRCITEVLQ